MHRWFRRRSNGLVWRLMASGLLASLLIGRVADAALISTPDAEAPGSMEIAEWPAAPMIESTPSLDWKDWTAGPRGTSSKKPSRFTAGGRDGWSNWRTWTSLGGRLASLLLCGIGFVCGAAWSQPSRGADDIPAPGLFQTRADMQPERMFDPATVPANAIGDAWDSLTDQRQTAVETLHHLRRNPDGQLSWKLRIRVEEPHEYPRIPFLDKDDPDSIFYTYRPNLAGRDTPIEWDFYNLIATDRPDFTDATFTVGRGVTYLETGFTFRRTSAGDLQVTRRQMPEALLRFGLTDEFELRLRWNGYIMTDVNDKGTALDRSGYGGDDIQLGFKYEVLQQKGWRPMVTVVGGTTLPSGTRNFSADTVQPFGNIVFGWGLRRWLYLKSMTGVDFVHTNDAMRVITGSEQEGPVAIDASDHIGAWHESLALIYQVNKHVGGFVEWFSYFSNTAADNRASNYWDAGYYFYVTPNVQFDVRYGQRISNRIDSMFTGMGFSTRW